jgi:hypothetical protein
LGKLLSQPGIRLLAACPSDISMTHVPHTQPHQITRSQLTVDGEVKDRQLSRAASDLEPYTNCPDTL